MFGVRGVVGGRAGQGGVGCPPAHPQQQQKTHTHTTTKHTNRNHTHIAGTRTHNNETPQTEICFSTWPIQKTSEKSQIRPSRRSSMTAAQFAALRYHTGPQYLTKNQCVRQQQNHVTSLGPCQSYRYTEPALRR